MKKYMRFPFAAIPIVAMFAAGCITATLAKEETATRTKKAATYVTNPNVTIAPAEYATLAKQSLMHLAKFNFNAFEATLADNVLYTFPDEDVDTRTKLNGKAAVVGWWKG